MATWNWKNDWSCKNWIHCSRPESFINAVLGLESSFGCCSDICVWLLRIWKHSSLHSYHFTLQISKKSECIRMFAIITFYQLFTHFQLYNLFSLFDDFHPKKSWLMTTSLVCCYSFIWTINVWTVHSDHSDQGWRGAAFVETVPESARPD